MHLKHSEKLSVSVRELLAADPAAYGQLVVRVPGDAGRRARLDALTADGLLDRAGMKPGHHEPLLAGLWLWHDFLDESHAISQGIETPTGSFWHAIMHRREGDFSNAKYWYARCRNHPTLREAGGGPWADELVDLVAGVHRNPDDPRYAQAVELQRLEWAALFDHCIAEASGS